jgi:predicted MFS family arabinose efflux permease
MNFQSDQNSSESSNNSELRSSWTSWLAVISISLGSFVLVTSEFLPIGLLTQIASSLHVSNGTAGLMVTVPGIVAAFAAPLMTICAGHVDRRTLVLTFIALLIGSNVLSALSPNFTMMLASRVLFGISLGGFWTIAVTLGNRLVPKSQMARATTLILGGVSLATVLGVPAGTVIAGYAGWRASFVAIGGAALVAGLPSKETTYPCVSTGGCKIPRPSRLRALFSLLFQGANRQIQKRLLQ